MVYPLSVVQRDQMMRLNIILTEEPYFLDFIFHLVTNYDFLDSVIQRDLLFLLTSCNQSIISDHEKSILQPWHKTQLFKWIQEKNNEVVSMLAVKEFMISALDDSEIQ